MNDFVKPDGVERRALHSVELRAGSGEDGGLPTISGHAAVFDQLSEDLGGFRERMAPGAFAASIGEDDIRALFNHSPDNVLGRNRAGTLTLAEDRTGLAIKIDPPDTAFARDLVTLIERGDISEMSIGFRTITDEWNIEEGEPVRTVKAVRLFDVSPVTFPAYPQTDVAVRSLESYRAGIAPTSTWRRDIARRRLDLLDT
tara:strand:+ start:776 stop:1375 length:600 start_codon:yes stop_codon:yes gene_type:complete